MQVVQLVKRLLLDFGRSWSPGLWDWAPCWALYLAWSPLEPLSLCPSYAPLSQRNKSIKKKMKLRLSNSVDSDIIAWERKPKGGVGLEEIEGHLLEHIESMYSPVTTGRVLGIPVWAPGRLEPRQIMNSLRARTMVVLLTTAFISIPNSTGAPSVSVCNEPLINYVSIVG